MGITIKVALRKESVDRNCQAIAVDQILPVALRKESVDRNLVVALLAVGCAGVALRKESVDRNLVCIEDIAQFGSRSPQGERG